MNPLRAMQGLLKSLFDRGDRPLRTKPSVRNARLHVEQLEDRATRSSFGGLTEALGGIGWGIDGWGDWNLASDSVRHESQPAGKQPLTSSPQSSGTGNGSVSASGQGLATIGNSPATGTLPSSPQVHPPISIIVTIATPAANSNVPGGGTFSTFGYVSPSQATMTAWVTTANGTRYNGTAITPLPPFQWGFKFTGIPTGSQVTLTVQGAASGSTGSQSIFITPT